ncbi:hypothetical protein D307_gp251 [Bacillus phage Bastille]|uniref:DUF7349 domain-containing protein n=3 Tax=Bastillevirus TaxID=1918010 RepID=A0A024B0B6_9CAUD|nr:hypothetical protein D307_gp251 [Bacillus phage Bastille]YP_009035604.1 hypothetical protein FP76_gp287 [Bacillus phage Evoli]AEQ34213.1 hypothetical protein [Bacillus phage Bastille]AHZ09807.1 hypothetical protein [Bacillus phage Evoli]AMW61836.1 hypothetical protein DNAM5_92 [Bacillus phage Vinny]
MLIGERVAGKVVATVLGQVTFNEKGEAEGLTDEQEQSLAHIGGFTYIAPEVKEEPKQKAAPKSKSKPAPKKAE